MSNGNTYRLDTFRQTTDFTDLLKAVSFNFEMYSKTVQFIGPWVAKQNSSKLPFMVPSKEQLTENLIKFKPHLNFLSFNGFVDSVHKFLVDTKGRKMLITPHPSSHHSVQFTSGTFEINKIKPILVRDVNGIRRPTKVMHEINFSGIDTPVYIENFNIDPSKIRHIVVRPKLGKLGVPSVQKWEVILNTGNIKHDIEHLDSTLNPRWSGIL